MNASAAHSSPAAAVSPPPQAELDLGDLDLLARRLAKLRTCVSVRPTADGLGIVVRPAGTELWLSTEETMRRTGLSRKRLYELGRLGLIVGEQPNKVEAVELRKDGRETNRRWQWSAVSVEAFVRRRR